MTDPAIKEFLAAVGGKGGKVKSERKRLASRANFMKAREMKLQYRLNPSLRKDKQNGNQG